MTERRDFDECTDEQLDRMTEITPGGVDRAAALWDRDSGMPGLLDAEPVDAEAAGDTTRK